MKNRDQNLYFRMVWEDTLDERQENGVEFPFKTNEFKEWLSAKGYKNLTIKGYIDQLIELDKLIVTAYMPMFDIYMELPDLYEERDLKQVRIWIREYERLIEAYMNSLKGFVEGGSSYAEAEYEEVGKWRSAWHAYSRFLVSLLKGDEDEDTVKVNSCVIPLKCEFIDFQIRNQKISFETARGNVSRLRSMNDKYLSRFFTKDLLPFHDYDFDPQTSDIIENLDVCIAFIEKDLGGIHKASEIQTLKRYKSLAQMYKDFLIQKYKS